VKKVRTRAPGRVNLIGEHTDYNDGFVMPCAIANQTRVDAVANADHSVTVRSSGHGAAAFDVDRLPPKPQKNWSDYVAGILIELRKAGVALSGGEYEISSSVPIGAGLSSSASLEIAVALAVLALSNAQMAPRDLALLAQRAESEFVGIRCGIMDQFAVVQARAGTALFLDTRSLEFQYIEIPSHIAILICNTMVKHSLAGSAYNDRRRECEEGVRILRQRDAGIHSLRDVCAEMLEHSQDVLPPLILKRCRHVVTENERVQDAARALSENDVDRMGTLMYASHESLRVDYEASCAELDLMVECAKRFDGTIGARMTGGGFGGCTVNLVHVHRAQAFREHMQAMYAQSTGITPEIYDGTPSAGASVLYG